MAQVRLGQVGAGKVGEHQHRSHEAGATQLRPGKVCDVQDHAGKVGVLEVGTRQLGAFAAHTAGFNPRGVVLQNCLNVEREGIQTLCVQRVANVGTGKVDILEAGTLEVGALKLGELDVGVGEVGAG